MTADLKPCPFCGEKCRVQPNGWTTARKPSWWEVACDKCDFVHAAAYTEVEAIAAWNTRAVDPAAIREAALREAAKIYMEVGTTWESKVDDAILALIEKKGATNDQPE